MKTKLEVGKEYWLGEAKKFKGIYKGSFGKSSYFDVTYGDANFTRDANGYVEFPERGVFEIEKPFQFTTPIAMKCTEEQFNGIKDKLADMGYKFYGITFGEKYRYLSSNFAKDKRCITDLALGSKYFKECNPIIFEAFNTDLFLAIAAMTDKEDGIKGEWWRYTDEMSDPIVAQKYLGEFAVPNKSWRKATAQEIIEHFEKKEFVLPSRWRLKVDSNNEQYVNNWRNLVIKKSGKCPDDYIGEEGLGCASDWGSEITFDQFKKYVLKETAQSCPKKESVQIIPIPPTKQATLFEDRVEITDWEPKEGETVWVITRNKNSFEYKKYSFDASIPFGDGEKVSPFIKRTESEAKQLVEKLKQAML